MDTQEVMTSSQNHLAEQADSINIARLQQACSRMGLSVPASQEECAASLGELVNRLTAAVVARQGGAQ